MNRCELLLIVEGDTIEVEAKVTLEKEMKLSFALKDSFNMLYSSAKYETESTEPNFIGKCNKYILKEETDNFTLRYRGKPYGFCTECSDEKVLLSFYCAWYPILDDFLFDDIKVIIKGLENFIVLDAVKEKDFWIFNNKIPFDCNIRAFNKDKVFSSECDFIKIYSGKKSELGYINKIVGELHKINEYYKRILGEKESNKLQLISTGIENSGGYFREGFIVLPCLEDNDKFIYSFLGHELAHAWHMGYSVTTYDDWLNETGAEWSSLSYILSIGKNDLYNKQIQYARKAFEEYPIMKPEDGSRPRTAHFGGVLLFDKIYERYGLDTINKLLRLAYETTPKNTDEFLKRVKGDFDTEIYNILSEPFR